MGSSELLSGAADDELIRANDKKRKTGSKKAKQAAGAPAGFGVAERATGNILENIPQDFRSEDVLFGAPSTQDLGASNANPLLVGDLGRQRSSGLGASIGTADGTVPQLDALGFDVGEIGPTHEGTLNIQDRRDETFADKAVRSAKDIAAEKKLEAVDWRRASLQVMRLLHSGDEDAFNQGVAYVNTYGPWLDPFFRSANLDYRDFQNFGPNNGVGRVLDSPVGRSALQALEIADMPSQGVLQAIGDVRNRDFGSDLDKDDDGSLNFREAIGVDPETGGRLLGAVDTIATVVADPVTYLTFGMSAASKAVVKEAAQEVGQDTAERFARQGLKGISAEEQRQLTAAIAKKMDPDVIKPRLRDRAVGKGAPGTGNLAEQQVKKASTQATSLVRVGGVPVVPMRPVRRALNKVKVLDETPAFISSKATKGTERSFQTTLRNSKLAQHFVDAVKPRADITRNLGSGISDSFRDIEVGAEASANRAIKEVESRIGQNFDGAVRELGDEKAVNDLLLYTLDNGFEFDVIDDHLRKMRVNGQHSTASLIETLMDLKSEARDRAVASGVPESQLRDLQDYTPRILTEEAREKAETDLEFAGLIGMNVNTGGQLRSNLTDPFLKARTFEPSLSLTAANRTAVARGMVENGVKLFDDDYIRAIALRSESAIQQAVELDMLSRLSALKIPDTGTPLVMTGFTTKTRKQAKEMMKNAPPGTYKKIDFGDDFIIAPPELEDPLTRTRDIIYNDKTLELYQKNVRAAANYWATVATVFPAGFGFPARNMQGNVYLNFLGGLNNPARYGQAGRLQRLHRKITKKMAEGGVPFEDALKVSKLSDRDKKLIQWMKEDDIISSGFYGDLDESIKSVGGISTGGRLPNVSVKSDRLDKVIGAGRSIRDEFGAQGKVLSTARQLNTAVENNARIALYIDQISKHGSRERARQHVRQFLFDYQDLTPFEKGIKQNLSRFYTFQRKNFGVHMYTLAHNPGKITIPLHVERALRNTNRDSGLLIPQYASEEGQFDFGSGLAIGIDSPMDQFTELATIPVMAANMVPGSRDILPSWAITDKKDAMGRILGVTSGQALAMLTFGFEVASGTDSFTGANIEDETGRQTLKRFFDSIAPIWGKSKSFWERTERALGLDLGLDPLNPGNSRLPNLKPNASVNAMKISVLRDFLGFQATDLERTSRGQQIGRIIRIDDTLRRLERRGIDIPTIDELQSAGLIGEFNPIDLIMVDPDLDEDERMEAVLAHMSKDQLENPIVRKSLEAEGVDVQGILNSRTVSASRAREEARVDNRLIADMDAFQYAVKGREPTEEERSAIFLNSPDMPLNRQELQEEGIEPFIPNEIIARQEKEAAGEPEETGIDPKDRERFDRMAQAAGLSREELESLRPALNEVERYRDDAIEAGFSGEELTQEIISKFLSRKEQGILFGTEALENDFFDGILTDKDLEDFEKKVDKEIQVYEVLKQEGGWGDNPRAMEIYLIWDLLPKSEQELLGIPKGPVIPSRKDIRSESEIRSDAQKKLDIIRGRIS